MRSKIIEVKSPLDGTVISLSKVKDKTFSSGVLGKGAAIFPINGKVVSPINGVVDSVADAGHAVNLIGDQGEEILIHFGIDTVTLKGKPFIVKVKAGDRVMVGDVLLEADQKMITDAGLETVSPVLLLNSTDFKGIKTVLGKVKTGDLLFTIKV
ncbi:MAG: PTS glucose transporter subunit IIA [Treponema sp.]|nr:PTS glucose transporter subunit IIA [Treponema sp.]